MDDSNGDSRYHLPPEHNGKPRVLTPARKQRGDVVAVEGEKGGREYHSLADPLAFYVARGHITGEQYRSGERLHALWAKWSQSPFVQVRYEETDGGMRAMSFVPAGFGGAEYRAALAAVTDPKARTVVMTVCCDGHPATRAMPCMSRRSAERHGMRLLREALDDLTKHFKKK